MCEFDADHGVKLLLLCYPDIPYNVRKKLADLMTNLGTVAKAAKKAHRALVTGTHAYLVQNLDGQSREAWRDLAQALQKLEK